MTDKIEPALTAEEWHEYEIHSPDDAVLRLSGKPGHVEVSHHDAELEFPSAGVIAIANDALHDSDPRKITREWIILCRFLAGQRQGWDIEWGEEMRVTAQVMADALESYLPPGTET